MPVPDLEQGVSFYQQLLGQQGEAVSSDRHYFDCDGLILAVLLPEAEGRDFRANPEWTYLAFEDVEFALATARRLGAVVQSEIETHPWGERSAYMLDPFGNPLCFVQAGSEFTGGAFVP